MTPSTKTVTKFLMAATQMSIWEMVEIKVEMAMGTKRVLSKMRMVMGLRMNLTSARAMMIPSIWTMI